MDIQHAMCIIILIKIHSCGLIFLKYLQRELVQNLENIQKIEIQIWIWKKACQSIQSLFSASCPYQYKWYIILKNHWKKSCKIRKFAKLKNLWFTICLIVLLLSWSYAIISLIQLTMLLIRIDITKKNVSKSVSFMRN